MSRDERIWTVLNMLEWATEFFQKKEIPNPRHSIEWLLAEVMDCKRLDLYLQFDRPLSQKELAKLRPLIKRRAAHEPLQYIVGYTQFMGCEITVNPSVLIPRIETEQLVEILLSRTADKAAKPIKLLDIGTGSGCIPLAVKETRPEWNCAGIDISPEALEVATHNAQQNNLDVQFLQGDLFNLAGSEFISNTDWNVIVSNPPYIQPEEKSVMEPQVTQYEPASALFHEQPHQIYQAILEFAGKQNALLFLECNDRTARSVLDMARSVFSDAVLHNDLDNNPRFITAG